MVLHLSFTHQVHSLLFTFPDNVQIVVIYIIEVSLFYTHNCVLESQLLNRAFVIIANDRNVALKWENWDFAR